METLTKRDEPTGEETDSDCPWCGDALYQGGELRYCAECPFSAMYYANLSDNPPYIIEAFAEWKEERFREAMED